MVRPRHDCRLPTVARHRRLLFTLRPWSGANPPVMREDSMQSRIFVGALGATFALMAGAASAQTVVGMATSPAGSLYHTQGSAVAPILKEKGNIEIRIQPFAS